LIGVLENRKKILRFQIGNQPVFFSQQLWQQRIQQAKKIVTFFHQENPHLPGIHQSELNSRLWHKSESVVSDVFFQDLVATGELKRTGELIFLAQFNPELSPAQLEFYQTVTVYLQNYKYIPPLLKEVYLNFPEQKKLLDILIAFGKTHSELVILPNGLLYLQSILLELQQILRQYLAAHPTISVAEFRDLIQVNRKYAVALLEYLDDIGFTKRVGDQRVLNANFKIKCD